MKDRLLAPEDSSTTLGKYSPKPQHIPTLKEDNKPLPQPRRFARLKVAAIAGGWFLAATFAVLHHVFLSQLNGSYVKNIPSADFGSQLWIKSGSIALVGAVVLSLGIAAGGVLTQLVSKADHQALYYILIP